MDVQQFERLLMRYERLAGRSRELTHLEKRHTEVLRTLITAQEGNSRRDREMQAALAKIEEWKVYAAQVALLVSPRREKELPPMRPTRLDFDIPF